AANDVREPMSDPKTPSTKKRSLVAVPFTRGHGQAVIGLRQPPPKFATGWVGKTNSPRLGFPTPGGANARACKRGSYFNLILRGHGGNDPGEGTIKARHLQ